MMETVDEIIPVSWILPTFRKIGGYVYQNIQFPRVSPAYREDPNNRFRGFRESASSGIRAFVVGVYDVFASVHPNYYVIALGLSLAAIFVYIKIRYPFWNNRPVVHTYDLYRRWFARSPYIIQKYPYKHKWYDSGDRVQTLDFARISGVEKKKIAEFIQSHYIPTDRLLSTMTAKTMDAYMTGHNAPAFVSAHTELDGTLTGVATSRPIQVWMSCSANPSERLDAYYLDFICVHREQSGSRHISETLFTTHEYNQRIRNPAIPVSFFKKEGALCEGVVPLVEYTQSVFYIRPLLSGDDGLGRALGPMPAHFQIVRVAKANGDLLLDMYHILTGTTVGGNADTRSPHVGPMPRKGGFDVCILPDLGNFRGMLLSKELYLYCLKKGNHLYGVYVFRNAQTHYEDIDGDTLELVASIQNSDSTDLFFRGFVFSLREILKENRQYKMSTISSIGHNRILLAKWREYHHTILETPGALYLYNYVFRGVGGKGGDNWFVVA